MDKKGQDLPLTTIIIAVLVIIVLVVLILIFTGKVGEWRTQTEQIGSIERFAGGEVDENGNCRLATGFIGTCRAVCPPGTKWAKQDATALRSELCKFGMSCCAVA